MSTSLSMTAYEVPTTSTSYGVHESRVSERYSENDYK